jgi:uncharacterized protein YsxB (DUF464 family)
VIEVFVRRDSRDRLSSIFADGHADFTEEGVDLICAAVSAILQAAWLGLTDVAHVRVEATKSEGRLSLRWPEQSRANESLAAIVGTAEKAVETLSRQFPDHVRIHQETEP